MLCVELFPYALRECSWQEFAGDVLRPLAESTEVTWEIDTFLLHPSFPVDIRHNAKIFRESLATWAARRLL